CPQFAGWTRICPFQRLSAIGRVGNVAFTAASSPIRCRRFGSLPSVKISTFAVNVDLGEGCLRGRETRRGARKASSWNERLTPPRRKSDWIVLQAIRRTSREFPRDGSFETPACVPTWPQSVVRSSRGTSRLCDGSHTPCGPPSAG